MNNELIIKIMNQLCKFFISNFIGMLVVPCYSMARTFIRKLGAKLNITISPHDLRRYSATYASRN